MSAAGFLPMLICLGGAALPGAVALVRLRRRTYDDWTRWGIVLATAYAQVVVGIALIIVFAGRNLTQSMVVPMLLGGAVLPLAAWVAARAAGERMMECLTLDRIGHSTQHVDTQRGDPGEDVEDAVRIETVRDLDEGLGRGESGEPTSGVAFVVDIRVQIDFDAEHFELHHHSSSASRSVRAVTSTVS
ncbi:hypothetical protein IU433_28665 [Nocardia puris]|uniref:Uncharacterized protein n=1 Tax=Nocardia puris TaxID=208602 RepID=A0A366D2Y4_9NOCA|nr:hypothetical protein [Nocardia puris]MBF6213855.1 hypothetical protein [Nocardia puris]MBF6368494.1 hypothetical protein [Nocardia puris]MBF6462981.1 hypothetical protein [Nocardia puris]RBO84275.1 hypothetical protein DFR74_11796 [Nocardia puris]